MRTAERYLLLILVFDSWWQVDDMMDDLSEDEAKEKDSGDIMKDSLIKLTKKKAKAKSKK